jgi:hypothetical protein
MKKLIHLAFVLSTLATTGCVFSEKKSDFIAVTQLNCYTWEEQYGIKTLRSLGLEDRRESIVCNSREIAPILFVKKDLIKSMKKRWYQSMWCVNESPTSTQFVFPTSKGCEQKVSLIHPVDACLLSSDKTSIAVAEKCEDILKQW